MNKYMLLLCLLTMSACVGNNADSYLQERVQSVEKEQAAFAKSQSEINQNCGEGGMKKLPRKGAGKYGECVVGVYINNVMPVTMFQNEFAEFLEDYKEIFVEYENGSISRKGMISQKDKLVEGYINRRTELTNAKLENLQALDRFERQQAAIMADSVSDFTKQMEEQRQKNTPQQSYCHVYGYTARCTTY